MAPTARKNTRSIAFTQSAPDKALLEAIDHELAEQQYASFDELCKEALQQFLLTIGPTQAVSEDAPNIEALSEQLAGLQDQLARLEQIVTAPSPAQQAVPQEGVLLQRLEQLEARLHRPLETLQERLTHLEAWADEQLPTPSEPFEQQILNLAQRVEHLEETLDQPLTRLTNQVTQLEQKLLAKESSQFSEFENQLIRLALQIERLETKDIPLAPVPEPEARPSHGTGIPFAYQPPAAELSPLGSSYYSAPSSVHPTEDPVLNRLSALLEDF